MNIQKEISAAIDQQPNATTLYLSHNGCHAVAALTRDEIGGDLAGKIKEDPIETLKNISMLFGLNLKVVPKLDGNELFKVL